jgi:AraC-like DNA-binding protein
VSQSKRRTDGNAPSDEVIVIGPPEVWRPIARSVDGNRRVLAFTTLEELDRWRLDRGFDDPDIYPDLVVALSEIGCRLGMLPRKLRSVLEEFGGGAHVPRMREIGDRWPSRRSFYRMWHQRIEVAPAALLRRVRALHARRLMANGRSKKEAALLAGYSSVDQMRRNLAE